MVKFDASMILLAGKQVKGLNILDPEMLAGGAKFMPMKYKCAMCIGGKNVVTEMCRVHHWQ